MFVNTETPDRISLSELARKNRIKKDEIQNLMDLGGVKALRPAEGDKVPHFRPSQTRKVLQAYKEGGLPAVVALGKPAVVRSKKVRSEEVPAPSSLTAEAVAEVVSRKITTPLVDSLEITNRGLTAIMKAGELTAQALGQMNQQVMSINDSQMGLISNVKQLRTSVRALDKSAGEKFDAAKGELQDLVKSEVSAVSARLEVVESYITDLDDRSKKMLELLEKLTERGELWVAQTKPEKVVKRHIGLVGFLNRQGKDVLAKLPPNVQLKHHTSEMGAGDSRMGGFASCEMVFLATRFASHAMQERLTSLGVKFQMLPDTASINTITEKMNQFLEQSKN